MKVASIKSRTVKTYTLTIDDGEIRPQQHSRAGRVYRVHRIEVVKTDGNVSSVSLSGTTLKKDGTDSLNYYSERLYRSDEWPQWLVSIVGGLA